MDETLLNNLRTAYDRKVEERAGKTIEAWKVAERARFLAMLQAEGKQTLLEIGMGTGRDSRFFQQLLPMACSDGLLTPSYQTCYHIPLPRSIPQIEKSRQVAFLKK